MEERTSEAELLIPGRGGEPLPMRTLFYEQTPEREIHVVCTPDGMRAYLRAAPGQESSRLENSLILYYLEKAGVVSGVMDAGVALLAALQNSSAPTSAYCQLARGAPMRKGENGSVEFHVQPTSFSPRYDQGDDGAIDYKQLNLIENCFAGQRVATIIPPGPGRPGTDVFGGEIPPQPGDPILVRAGPGITISPNGRDFTAEIEGRLVFEDGVLSVSPLLEINRDIDYSIGNVDFVGKVLVNGSLLDGFYINGKGGVEITGDVGASRITSEGDVKITGGIKGKNAAIITCRDLSARYIDDATAETRGDVAAAKEIINSNIKALGRISVADGAIIGGVVCGFRGVEADTLGSDMGVATRVLAGLDWTEENRKDEIRARVAELLDRVQSSKALLDPLFADKEIHARLGTDQKSMLSELIAELRDIREDLTELLDERENIAHHRQEGVVDQINVRKIIYQGVEIRFGSADAQVKDSVKGPVSVMPDAGRKTLSYGAHKELPQLRPPGRAEGAEE